MASHDMFEWRGVRYRRDDLEQINGQVPEDAVLEISTTPVSPTTQQGAPGIVSSKASNRVPANKAG